MNLDLKEQIIQRLNFTFQPEILMVRDDSALHAGHAGNTLGAGHFYIEIKSSAIAQLKRIQQHQRIYACLQEFFPAQIHALEIKILK